MAQGRQQAEWLRMSSLMCLIANVNRDPRRGRAFRPADFNPFPVAAATAAPVDMATLREAFGVVGERKKRG